MVKEVRNTKTVSRKWIIIIIAIILIAGVVGFLKFRNKKQPNTVTVQKGSVKEELVLTGSVEATKYSNLAFPTGGKISWVSGYEGQKVKKGQAITSLDRTVLNTAYQQALNTYRKYQATAENILDQVKNHSSDETFNQKDTRTTAEVNRDNSYDAVVAAQYNLANATIYAPFDGVISSLPFPSAGVNVLASDVQVVIVDPSTIYFDVSADQNDVTNISIDQNVDIVLDSFSDKHFTGKVSFISLTPKPNESGTNYRVKVVFNGEPFQSNQIRIGMTGDARFILNQKDNVLYVPNEFINTDKEGKFVYLGKNREKTRIEVGIEGETVTEIKSGVKDGDVLYD